ncbi:tetratricopeptide repeat protein 26, partial [Kipferlia bialata]
RYEEAIECLEGDIPEPWTKTLVYKLWLCRCYIKLNRPQKAFNVFTSGEPNADAFILLQMIADDCYESRLWKHAARAFRHLVELEEDNEQYIAGYRGACAAMVLESKGVKVK